jgi:hypothetical protein
MKRNNQVKTMFYLKNIISYIQSQQNHNIKLFKYLFQLYKL